jgi:hypothetical protein
MWPVCPQAWKVEDFLAKWEGTCSGTNAADAGRAAIALVLLKEIDAYRFVATLQLESIL